MDHRLWMYNMHYEISGDLKHEFIDGVRDKLGYDSYPIKSKTINWAFRKVRLGCSRVASHGIRSRSEDL
ncbi:hypothetical protein H5410_040413 [Solanum commersonii]|uniref:Uncharacterized protein n=1 Tax=Solanum commersonii TaxID=4109 RepID=A0A9J5XNT2_SOLCO|nr:hypothetical protein H5410_040413 [Solanum commersonii]